MIEIQNYGSFVTAIVVFQLVLGPESLAILNATARHGIGAGLGAVLGTLSGDLIYMVAAVAGLAAVMRPTQSPFRPCNGSARPTSAGWDCNYCAPRSTPPLRYPNPQN